MKYLLSIRLNMRKIIALLTVFLMVFVNCSSATANSHNLNFQSYAGSCPRCGVNPCNCGSSGGCGPAPCCSAPSCCQPMPCDPPCDPCAPCAPACGLNCGVSICAIGVAILAIVGAAALILSSEHVHTH